MLNDIKVGDIAEQLVIDTFAKHGLICTKVEKPDRSFYDLCFSEGPLDLINILPFYVECKHDVMAKKTGNVAIEFYNPKSGKPSGIGVTKATIWCHIMEGEIWAVKVEKLKNFLARNHADRIINTGGDGNASLYLYSKDKLLGPLMTKLNDITTKELIKFLI